MFSIFINLIPSWIFFRSYVVGYNYSEADKTALNAVLVAVGGLPNKEVTLKINCC